MNIDFDIAGTKNETENNKASLLRLLTGPKRGLGHLHRRLLSIQQHIIPTISRASWIFSRSFSTTTSTSRRRLWTFGINISGKDLQDNDLDTKEDNHRGHVDTRRQQVGNAEKNHSGPTSSTSNFNKPDAFPF